VAQTKILGLQERIEDQKSTEQLLSTRFTSLSKSLEDLRTSQEASKGDYYAATCYLYRVDLPLNGVHDCLSETEVSMKTSADLKVFELEVQRLSEQVQSAILLSYSLMTHSLTCTLYFLRLRCVVVA
jgi:hypothetical protein